MADITSVGIQQNGTNVGIGTLSPAYKLEVNGVVGITGATNIFGQTIVTSDSTEQIIIRTATDTNRQLIMGYNYSGNYGAIQAVQQGTAYIPLILNQSGGNVGIGTTSPGTKLTIRASAANQSVVNITSTTNNNLFNFISNDTPGYAILDMGKNTESGTFAGGYIRLRTDGDSWIQGGNVGIGTTTPTFSNGGGLVVYNAGASRIKISNSTGGSGATDGFELIMAGLDAYVYNYEAGPMIFGTSNTERMRITSGGTLQMAATTISNNNAAFGTETNGGYKYFQGTLANGEKFGSQGGTYALGFYFITWFDGASVRGYAMFATTNPTANAGTVLISSGGGTYTVSATYNASNAISLAFDGSSRGAVLSNNTGVGLTFYAYVFGGA